MDKTENATAGDTVAQVRSLTDARDFAAAQQCADTALKEHPANFEIVAACARLALHAGALEKSAALWKSATELAPDSYEAHRQAASVLRVCGRFDEA
ncbi:MAG: tetratricopeptide repeat protein [Pseudomonadota bacterium]